MAEYAGLEIRIGGNTSKLTNALKASTKSAAELQRRIRQATRAMQFDPTDLKNVETRIKLTGDRMQSLQSKAQIARTAMQQLGDSMVTLDGKPKKIRDVAEETRNLSLKAKQADERFNGLTGTLAKIYESWNKLSRGKGMDFARDELGIDAKTADYLMRTTTSLSDFRAELNNINQARASGLDFGPVITPDQLATLTKLKELNFHAMFERGLDLDDVIEDAKNLGIVIEDSAIANVRELQKTFKEAQQDKKAFDEALKFEQLGTDIQRIDSEAESLSQTMRQLDDALLPDTMSSRFKDGFQEIESQIRTVDAALKNVDHDIESTGEAMKVDPGNIEIAARYFNDLQQKAELSDEKVGLLKQQMELLDASGASEAAKGHQDLAKWIEESAESARVANKELSEQRATTANLEDQTKSLKQAIANMKGDSTLTNFSDNVLAWQRNTQNLTKEMENLATAERRAAEEQAKLNDAKEMFSAASGLAVEYKNKLDALRSEYKQLESAAEEALDKGELTPEMVADLSSLENEIERVEAAYKGAQTNVEMFNRELKSQQDRAKTAQSSLDQQKTKVDELKKSVSELEKTREVKLFKDPTGEIEKAEGELRELQGELDKSIAKENELEDAYDSAKTENELAKTAQAFRETSKKADETSAAMKKAQDELNAKSSGIFNPSTIKSIGMTLSATLTPAISAVGYKMVDAGSTVDSAYRDMRKTVEGTEEQFESLRQGAIDFSRTHVTSADQILQIEAIGGELGVATEHLASFAEAISNIDVATNLDAEGAAEVLGHLSNVLKLNESDYEGFSNALVRLGNNGASTETEIANIAERIGAMGSIVGMSGSDILAWSSTIASTGQNAEAAGTAISRTMSFMETAVAAAGGTMDTSFEAISAAVEEGGDKLTVFASLAGMTAEDFAASWETNSEDMAANLNDQLDSAKESLQLIADVAHMSADEFAKTWESDPTEALKAFIVGLNDVEAAEGSADKVLQDLGITAVRQKQAIEGLMQSVGGLDDNLKMSEDAWNGISDQWGQAGDAANEAAKKAEGFSGQMQILKNMGQNTLAELSEGAVPWIKMLSGGIEDLSQWFSTLSTDTKKWIVMMGGVAAAAGPFLSWMGTFRTSKEEFGKWFDEVTSGMSLIRLAFKYGGEESEIFNSALAGTVTTMDKVKLVGMELGASLLKGLAVGAVVLGVVAIGTALKELYDQYQDHIAATEGLSDALEGIGVAATITEEGTGKAKRSLDELLFDAGASESRLADLARTIEDSNAQYGNFAGQMDYYASTIETLGGKADRSKEETYKLEAALRAVNDACGTTYGLDNYGNIIDTETGKVQKNTDVIRDNIDARKQQALIDYYADDYAKATEEWAAAQDRVNDLETKLNDMRSGNFARDDLSDEAYASAIRTAEIELANAQTELTRTEETMGVLEGKIHSAEKEVKKFNKSVENAAKAQEQLDRRTETVSGDVTGNMKRMSEAVNELGKSDRYFNRVAEGLTAIHVSADEMNDVDMSALVSAYSSVGGSMEQVVAALTEGGVQMDTWNAALEQAPGAAEHMSSVTAAAFDSMYEIAGNDLNGTMTLIAGLDEVQVGDKTFYIGDNGSIVDSKGKVYDLEADLASIPDEVITAYYVDDSEAQQKTLDAKAKLTDVGKQNPKPKIGVVDNASGPTDKVKGKLDNVGAARPTPSVNLNDNASGPLAGISSRISSLDGRHATITVTTVERTVKQATGGLNNHPVIPRHATGYIATGPTLTNQGWIGEDGIEAVANWATGGAVVPLTNRKYMLPIADAIAEGMASRGVGGGAQYNVNINGARVNDDPAIQSAVLNLFDVLQRKGAMNRG